MRIEAIPARDLDEHLLDAWTAIQRADDRYVSPYFCPAFTQAVAAVRSDVYVGVMEDGGKPVGFFPFQRSRLGAGRPVGAALSDYHGVIGGVGVGEWTADQLLRQCGLCYWDFDHLLVDDGPFRAYHMSTRQSPIMDLSEGYEAYAQARRAAGSKQILQVGAHRRQFERVHGPLRFEAHTEDGEVLAQLFRWKSAQYLRSGITDVMSFDWVIALLERIRSTQTDGFAGLLSALWSGDRLVAVHLGMRSHATWHYWFPSYDVACGKASPGLILLLEMAEAACDLGVESIDLGAGDARYKRRLMSRAVPLAVGALERSSLPTTCRRWYRQTEAWVRRSPFVSIARVPGRLIKRMDRRSRFR